MQNSANYVIISCFVFNRASCSKQLSQGGICALIFHLPLTSSWVTVPPPFRVSDWELAASIFLRLADLVLFTTHRCLRQSMIISSFSSFLPTILRTKRKFMEFFFINRKARGKMSTHLAMTCKSTLLCNLPGTFSLDNYTCNCMSLGKTYSLQCFFFLISIKLLQS